MARAFRAEFRRLRGDIVPWAFLPVALLSALSVAASLPGDIRSAPPAVIDAIGATLRESLLGGLLILAAILGALGVTLADKTGVLAREQLYTRGTVIFGVRAASSILSTLVFGAFGVAVVEVVFFFLTGRALFSLRLGALAVLVTAGVGLWGYLVGVLVRSPVLVLFVAPVTLSPALLLADAAPDVARFLPLGAFLSAAGASDRGLDAPAAAVVAAVWVVALALAAVLVLRRRDRL